MYLRVREFFLIAHGIQIVAERAEFIIKIILRKLGEVALGLLYFIFRRKRVCSRRRDRNRDQSYHRKPVEIAAAYFLLKQKEHGKADEDHEDRHIAGHRAVCDEHDRRDNGDGNVNKGLVGLHGTEYRKRRQRDKDDAVRAAVIVDDPAAHAEPLAVGAVRCTGQHRQTERRGRDAGGEEQPPIRLVPRLVVLDAVHEADGEYRHLRDLRGI